METSHSSSVALPIAFSLFFVGILLVSFVMYGFGIAALISIARKPAEAFGPWWDNTKQIWIIGIAVSFLVPLGSLISGIMWFTAGNGPLRHGLPTAGRPFWSGPPKPPPYTYPPPPGSPPGPPPYPPSSPPPYNPPGPPYDPPPGP